MPIRSRKNQYLGINAHLNSYLLREDGGWHSFHTEHIVALLHAINAQLPSNYYARVEKSIQISEHDLLTGSFGRSRTVPDVHVYTTGPRDSTRQRTGPSPAPPTTTLPLEESFVLTEEETVNAVVIYQVRQDVETDVPVTHIELLSNSNKPPNAAYRFYVAKRKLTLESGIRLVELDYIHETRSPILTLPAYPERASGAYPYLILISDPRPSIAEAMMQVYGFHVDDPVPVVDVPLAGSDRLPFDFGAVYDTTFRQNPFYGTRAVDYEQLPEHFDTYSPEDQQRIRRRMEVVRQAVEAGRNLDEGPFPIP